MFRIIWACCFILCWTLISSGAEPSYQYFRTGNTQDVTTKTQAGFALMGGGSDLDEAFQWMCQRSGGGDFVIIRATGDDAYNPYVEKLCKVNSVATIVIPTKEAAQDPEVADYIRHAEALFISGGDQANYIKYWQGTPVQEAINDLIRHGVPVGGTSAGLAVMGQFVFSAINDSAYSKESLANPYDNRVTIARDFLHIPHLQNLITDTHFAKRDREGRLIVFMARILQDGMAKAIRGIGVDEKSAGLMEPDGSMKIVGFGTGAFFYRSARSPEECTSGKPLTFKDVSVQKVATGQNFNVASWKGEGVQYSLNVVNGALTTTSSNAASASTAQASRAHVMDRKQ